MWRTLGSYWSEILRGSVAQLPWAVTAWVAVVGCAIVAVAAVEPEAACRAGARMAEPHAARGHRGRVVPRADAARLHRLEPRWCAAYRRVPGSLSPPPASTRDPLPAHASGARRRPTGGPLARSSLSPRARSSPSSGSGCAHTSTAAARPRREPVLERRARVARRRTSSPWPSPWSTPW